MQGQDTVKISHTQLLTISPSDTRIVNFYYKQELCILSLQKPLATRNPHTHTVNSKLRTKNSKL